MKVIEYIKEDSFSLKSKFVPFNFNKKIKSNKK